MEFFRIDHLFLIALTLVFVFLINIPFGIWRESCKKMSFWWFVAIHFPVGLIIAFRHFVGLSFEWVTFPLFIVVFFLGQRVGAVIRRKQVRKQGQDTPENNNNDLAT